MPNRSRIPVREGVHDDGQAVLDAPLRGQVVVRNSGSLPPGLPILVGRLLVQDPVELGLDALDESGEPLAPEHLGEGLVVEGAAEPDVGRDRVEDVLTRNDMTLPGMFVSKP